MSPLSLDVMSVLIPKWKQTLFGNGDCPYGNIRLSLPISVRGLPIWKWGAYFWRLPPNFGQEIKIFPFSRDCDTLKALRIPIIARLPIIRSIALITIVASFSFGDCLNPCTSVFPFGDYLPPRSILQGL